MSVLLKCRLVVGFSKPYWLHPTDNLLRHERVLRFQYILYNPLTKHVEGWGCPEELLYRNSGWSKEEYLIGRFADV